MTNGTTILTVALQTFLASAALSWKASVAAHAEEPTSNTAIQSLEQLREPEHEMSMDERRLRFYLLNRDKTRQDAEQVFQQVLPEDIPRDVEVQRLAARAQHDQEAIRQLKVIVDRKQSLTASLLWLELAERRSKGSLKFAGRELIIAQEPAFLPAILSYLRNHRGDWLAFATYGSTALDLLDEGTAMSRAIVADLPGATETVATNAAAEALERFSVLSSTPTWRWSEKHPAERTWLEASLLYHAGQYERALTTYEHIVEGPSARPSAHYRLARLYELAQRQRDADATVQSGLAKFPRQNSPLLVLSADYDTVNGKAEEAVAKLRRCLAASPEYAPAHMLLAEVHAMRGEKQPALTSCADALAYDDDRWAGNFRARVHAVLRCLVQTQQKPGSGDRSGCPASSAEMVSDATNETTLIATVRDARTNVTARARAMFLLGEMRSTNAIPVLIEHLIFDEPSTKTYPAVAALSEIGTEAVEALKAFVLNARPEEQYREIGHAAAVIRNVLGDTQTDRWVEGCKSKMSRDTYQILMSREP